MIVKLVYGRGGFSDNKPDLSVSVMLSTDQDTLYKQDHTVSQQGEIAFESQIPGVPITLSVTCLDPVVYHGPLLINQIVLDEFYHLSTHAHHGVPVPHPLNSINVDPVPGNCLFFCGSLQWRWHGPTPQMVFPQRNRWVRLV